MFIGKHLKELRIRDKYKQKEIADMLGISVVTYNRFENNKRNPDFDLLKKICTIYNVDYDYILGTPIENNDIKLLKIYIMDYINTWKKLYNALEDYDVALVGENKKIIDEKLYYINKTYKEIESIISNINELLVIQPVSKIIDEREKHITKNYPNADF